MASFDKNNFQENVVCFNFCDWKKNSLTSQEPRSERSSPVLHDAAAFFLCFVWLFSSLLPVGLLFSHLHLSFLLLSPSPLQCLLLSTTFFGSGSWQHPADVGSRINCAHFPMNSSRSTTRHWTNSARRAKQGHPGQKTKSCDQSQVVLRGRLAWTDPVNARVQAVLLGAFSRRPQATDCDLWVVCARA